MIRLGRRDFLALVVATAAAPMAHAEGAGSPTRAASTRAAQTRAAQSLSRLLPRDLDVALIAQAYRKQRPEEGTVEQLVALLLAGVGPADEPALRRRLAQRSREDFAQGRTFEFRGWFLSLTEARLAALHDLVQQR